MQVFLGMLLLFAGVAVTASALPLTHRFVRILPHSPLSRGQVDQLASTTFLTAFIGLLMTVTGFAAVLVELLPD